MSKEIQTINLTIDIICGSDFQHRFYYKILKAFAKSLMITESAHKKNKVWWELGPLPKQLTNQNTKE